ncbi:MAG: sn-glycerol-3-phosphate ABC transporter ATP-binding protein UgpC [Gammaproteobacteria bacterium]|nr:sn-glycerol-3-phosphate ABC transporter ATP-binding protein UgpC [Gammaproteobacteria bacterium]
MSGDSQSNINPSFLKISNIHKAFGNVEVLHDINIDMEEGGFLVLVGPSGCGKSTLLNLIAGFETPSSGDIALGCRSIMGLHPSQRDIAMVFQSYALYPNMNVEKNIGFGMETRGVPKNERKQKIAEVADILQIGQLLKRKPAQLSGGQRQRVAMGRALVRDPRVFLFDEPLSNLDARLRVDMRVEIKKLHERLGTTIVYVTHDQIEAMTLATKIAVLNDGQVLQTGTPEEIYDAPANEFVADFMGSPAMNKVKASLQPLEQGLGVKIGRHQISIPNPSNQLWELSKKHTDVLMGIRAEDITLADPINGSNDTITLPITFVEPTGSDTFITVQEESMAFIARIPNNLKPQYGETISLELNPDKLHFFSIDSRQRIA